MPVPAPAGHVGDRSLCRTSRPPVLCHDRAVADEAAETVLGSAWVADLGRRHPHWFDLPEGAQRWCEATLLGRGESFEAWTLTTTSLTSAPGAQGLDTRAVVLRTPHRGVAELPRPMAEEFAALRLAPAGLGPAPIHLQEHDTRAADGTLTPAYMVTEWVPGQVRDLRGWGASALGAHARCLARLHERTWPTPGEVRTAETNPPATLRASQELRDGLDWWERHRPGVLDGSDLVRLVPRVERAVATTDADFDALTRYSLVHGDPCAPNILLTSRGPRYIDWEWARIGDPARDLAFIGGRVWAAPFYLPLTGAQVDGFLRAYLDAGGAGREPDPDALARRRDAWLLTEALLVAVYLTWVTTAPDQAPRPWHARARTDLITRLAAAVP